jgi:hypothetical protein
MAIRIDFTEAEIKMADASIKMAEASIKRADASIRGTEVFVIVANCIPCAVVTKTLALD